MVSGGEDAYSDGEDAYGSGAAALAGAGFGAEAAAVQAAGSGPGEDDLLDQVACCACMTGHNIRFVISSCRNLRQNTASKHSSSMRIFASTTGSSQPASGPDSSAANVTTTYCGGI